MCGTLVQLSVSSGGMPKLAVPEALVTVEGVAGDWQLNRKYHGGAERAICLFSAELYNWLREEGIDLQWGSVGENFATRGIELGALSSGVRLSVGECVVEITKVRVPCRSLDRWDKRLKGLIEGRSGWMAKVIEDGIVREGMEIEQISLEGVSEPDWGATGSLPASVLSAERARAGKPPVAHSGGDPS